MNNLSGRYGIYKLKLLGTFLLGVLSLMPVHAQFYNGSQMPFGKSRVQYGDFLWTYYRFNDFDTYFYLNGKELAIYTARYAKEILPELESLLETRMSDKIEFIVFNSLTDLKQSNIGLVSEQQYNIGGITHIIENKVFIYFDGNYANFEKQIRAGMARALIDQSIYGGSVGRQITNATLMSMPAWFIDGLVSYIAEDWNTEIDNYMREGIISGRYRKFNHLKGEDAIYAGHGIWKYIADKYGKQAIPNIIYLARVSRNVETGFLYVLNISFRNLVKEWYESYRSQYLNSDENRLKPVTAPVQKKVKKAVVYDRVRLSSDGKYMAWISNQDGQVKVWLHDTRNGKSQVVYRQGHRLDEKNDLSYPLIEFHPNGNTLGLVTERKGEIRFYQINLESKRRTWQFIYGFQKIVDMAYSHDGRRFVMSAVRKGQTDIYVYNIAASAAEQITRDVYNDLNPVFINNSRQIVFSSNRPSDTLTEEPKISKPGFDHKHDLFLYDYAAKGKVLRRITDTPYSNEIQPVEYEKGYISYLGDENGIYNRYLAGFDSVITHVDTAAHYRYFTRTYGLTNYARNIVSHTSSPRSAKIAEIIHSGQFRTIYSYDQASARGVERLTPPLTGYMEQKMLEISLLKEKEKSAPAQAKPKERRRRFVNVYAGDPELPASDSLIDLDQYRLGREELKRPGSKGGLSPVDEKDNFVIPKQRNYNVEYRINELVSQLDFNFLSTSYQPFSGGGGPIFLTPGLNAFFRIGLSDLLEDYRIVAGVRLDFNLVNNEYVVSIANLKHRLDREIYFHRQSIEQTSLYSIVRYRIHELHYILKYPLNPLLSVKGTASMRKDRAVFMSTDQYNLREPDINRYWVSGKGELTYDATRQLGLNLLDGLRYKVFGEYYQQLDGDSKNTNMVVLGFDIRHYLPIHRNFIWANRFATSTSFGKSRLIYYMGGVDTWLAPKFTTDAPIDYSQNYAYQTLATNMRGFYQNVRNGNSFAVINSELRFPVFSYLANRPLRSDFLTNFQLIAFGDLGTAWTGATPYADENALFTRVINRGPLLITIREQREPLVGGLGFGARTRLLGYFLRADYAWGIEDMVINKPVFYISLSLDF
ncbi:protein containing WD40-like beta propeller repeat [Lentimicrobium saccharophilum]|uniref:Protein containing WD40-like beta propeller repeat n=1 Tax=Lentimicrobium saccharophilum TaxID=1678841 RepID=A0A0S7C367_9BACT|nr:PD40 domain-containing protein [Lentimicrobium saccharophilum]GAP43862.1 protein containing WD40-like beta propeller repeat [Lentimicrobium saccharophilum]